MKGRIRKLQEVITLSSDDEEEPRETTMKKKEVGKEAGVKNIKREEVR